MSTTAKAPHYFEDGSGFINLLVAVIFRRLEIDHQLIWLPAERSLVFTNNGTVDSIVPRAAAIEANYTNLIRVPVNVFDFDFMAFTRDPALMIDGWHS
ncbi:MAG: ABC transporter substrate-binding protein, partial [Gammaproteobacteria bacterium]|nr:ABC transporter substrate-binding protein [Gammaproteobacteria bacterium]